MKRYNTGFQDNLWSVPAGRVETGESFTQAAIREAREEVGVQIKHRDLSIHLIMHYQDERSEKIYTFFVCNKWDGVPYNAEQNKCNDIGWFNLNKLPKDIVKHVKDAIIAINKGETYLEKGF